MLAQSFSLVWAGQEGVHIGPVDLAARVGRISPAGDWWDDTCGGTLHHTDSAILTDATRCVLEIYANTLMSMHSPLGLMDKASDF